MSESGPNSEISLFLYPILTRFSLELSAMRASGSQSMDFIYISSGFWDELDRKGPKRSEIQKFELSCFTSIFFKIITFMSYLKVYTENEQFKKKIEMGQNSKISHVWKVYIIHIFWHDVIYIYLNSMSQRIQVVFQWISLIDYVFGENLVQEEALSTFCGRIMLLTA